VSVVPGVRVLSQPNHPYRLLWLFALTMGAAGLVAAAILALGYVIDDMRYGDIRFAATTEQRIDAPEGLMVVLPVEDAGQFEELTGFEPFVPSRLPESTEAAAVLAVTQPDERGRRIGRVAFNAKQGVAVEGITGPLVVILEAHGDPGSGVDGQLKRLSTGNGRTLVATLQCGDLVLDLQMYFTPGISPGEPFVTPYMKSTGEKFLDGVKDDCGDR
jgi:hypothetical protein